MHWNLRVKFYGGGTDKWQIKIISRELYSLTSRRDSDI